jgi:hypothetical protein
VVQCAVGIDLFKLEMKISTGKYVDQFAIGVTWLRYPNVTWSIIFDFGLWYVEVSSDIKETDEWIPYFTENILRCDRCGSPNDIKSHFNEEMKFELVCDECLRYEEYMDSISNKKTNKKNGTDSNEGTA